MEAQVKINTKFKQPRLKTKFIFSVLSYLFTYLSNIFSKKTSVVLPNKIGQYHLVKNLKTTLARPFAIGLYSDEQNTKVVAKVWTGGMKSINYFALLHEIIVYQALSNIQRGLNKSQAKIKRVSIPQYMGAVLQKNILILLTRQVEGKTLASSKDSKKMYSSYQNCVDYVRLLGSKCKSGQRVQITKSFYKEFFILYPLLVIAASIKNPNSTGLFFKGWLVFIKNKASFQQKNAVLIHGDLHPKNILVKENQLYILDWEQAAYTYPEYETISTILCWSSKIFFSDLMNQINESISKDKKKAELFGSLLCLRATHYLTGDLSPKKKRLAKNLLEFGISINKSSS